MTETIAGSLLFLRLESTAEPKRRGPAKTGPAVDPVAVSASPRRVGRSVGSTPRFGRDCWPQGQPRSTAYSETWAKTPRPKRPRSGRSTWPTRRERDAWARKTASRGASSRRLAQHRGHATTLTDTPTPLSAAGATASAPRVLVVDDAATFGDAARPLLKRRGYAVVAGPARRAASGRTDASPCAASASHFPPDRADAPPAELREPAWRAAAGRCPPPRPRLRTRRW